MQDTRLNYVEQHAARIGLDSERLESARVSASRSSPMGDTLDLCSRYADAASLPALIPRLSALVKRGTGLNTRVGTARFIVSLALRLGTELRPHSGALIKVGFFRVFAGLPGKATVWDRSQAPWVALIRAGCCGLASLEGQS